MLQFPVSGLQRLFSSASSSASRHKLESCIEEAHTYDLLFPEGVRHDDPAHITAAASSADDRGGLDISPRDVRIVIAQDATARSPRRPSILYDSNPPFTPLSQARSGNSPEAASRRQRAGSFGGLTGGGWRSSDSQQPRTAPHSRQSSFSQTAQPGITSPISPLSPVSELGGPLGNSKGQTSSARPATRDGETEALLDCMFGTYSGLASASGTKLHIRPPRSTPSIHESRPGTPARDPTSPVAFPKRKTPLTRSTTASELQNESIDGAQYTPRPDSCAIWITRLFSVDLNDPAFATHSSEDSPSLEQTRSRDPNGPDSESVSPKSSKREKAKQFKTPMYAIAMALHMPSHRQRPPTPLYSAGSPQFWPLDGSSSSNMHGLELSGDMEYVIAHRSAIDRALSELETVALSMVRDALSKADVSSPGLPKKESIKNSDSDSSITIRKPKQPTQRTLQLPAGALQRFPFIQGMADRTGKRIALVLKIRKVITGQGRWDAWRHELRWFDKRANNFFFFKLLTAYLASHTNWLQILAPRQYRRQYAKQAKDGRQENNKTVIVSSDKMGSRRLIFLLSAFLPGRHLNLAPDGRAQLDWSKAAYPDSPPSSRISQQHPLRTTTNGRVKVNPANENINLYERPTNVLGSNNVSNVGHPIEEQNAPQSSRRASDARSVGSVALLIASDGSVTRKSSITTTATIKPESAVPVAHFASHLNDALLDGERPRPSSSESLAPFALQRTLSRSGSNEHSTASTDSPPGGVWGSLSKIWGSRRGPSTEASDPSASSEEGLGISGIPRIAGRQHMSPSLEQMVGEVETTKVQRHRKESTDPSAAGKALIGPSQNLNSAFLGALTPKHMHGKLEPFPLNLSIDEHDGIVDVDLPQASSSTASSPIAVHTAASSLNDRSSLYGHTPSHIPAYPDSNTASYVAGWLRSYHPDLILQAVRPCDGLKDQIIRSMRTTPSPTRDDDGGIGEWSEICSTLIVDCSRYTVTRLRLRRNNAKSLHHRVNALLESPSRDVSHEEQVIEELLVDMDPDLTDAVEKVISHSGESSHVASRAPSPTRRRHHSLIEGIPGLERRHNECAKTVLGALEQVARKVSAEMAAQDQGGKAVGKRGNRYDGSSTESTLREGVRRWFQEVDSHST